MYLIITKKKKNVNHQDNLLLVALEHSKPVAWAVNQKKKIARSALSTLIYEI